MISEICSCGKVHREATKHIFLGLHAVRHLQDIIESNVKRILLISDANTAALEAYPAIKNSLGEYTVKEYIFKDKALVADEKAIGMALIALGTDTDLIIALGSGTINDISRYISYRVHIPYIIIASAPSMDGFASNVSPLIVSGAKITYEAVTPLGIIGDSDILTTAPPAMTSAGFGDLLGKYTCLCDWKLGKLVNDEYYCENVANMTQSAVDKCVASLDKLDARDLIDGLVLSGTAMSYVGNSRPASGCEHHLSHFWEMRFLSEGKEAVLHGTKVGIATVVILKLHELLQNETIDWDFAYSNAKTYSFASYQQQMLRIYKNSAEEIIESERVSGRNNPENTIVRIAFYQQNWDTILEQLQNCIPPNQRQSLSPHEFAKQLLQTLSAPVFPSDVGIDRKTFEASILYAKEIRQRFTVLQIAGDLGLLPKFSKELSRIFYDTRG